MGTGSMFSFHTYHSESHLQGVSMADLLAIAATVSFDDKTNAPAGWGDALQAQLGRCGWARFSE